MARLPRVLRGVSGWGLGRSDIPGDVVVGDGRAEVVLVDVGVVGGTEQREIG